jgi:hypothetical protein
MISYQIICTIVILATGGLGFYSLISGLYESNLNICLKFIPNSWFIMGFTDIIIYGSRGGYLNEGHRMLLVMSAVVLILYIGIDLLENVKTNFFQRIFRNRTVRKWTKI